LPLLRRGWLTLGGSDAGAPSIVAAR